MTPAEFAAKIKAKYPDYASVPDDELVSKITTKYPEYKSQITMPEPVSAGPNMADRIGSGLETARNIAFPLLNPDVQRGITKSAGGLVSGLGQIVAGPAGRPEGYAVDSGMINPDSPEVQQEQALKAESFKMADEAMAPRGGGETLGKALGDTAQFVALPGESALARGVGNASLAKAQGASTLGSLGAGAIAAVPAGRLVASIGERIAGLAPGLVRSAIKPTVAAMRRISGGAGEGLDAKANSLVNFIIENKLTTPDKAQKMLSEAEKELQRALKLKNAPTDAPQRALRYLDALEKQAQKAGLGDDVQTIRKAAEEVFASEMGTAVPGIPGARTLRTDMPASEALDVARLRGRLQNRKAYGELKSTSVEASKAIERAGRDAVKAAVPEAAPILQREGRAIQAKDVLDRMQFRQGNRDALSLPAHIQAAGGVAAGMPGTGAVLAMAANWLRNNQMKAGIFADVLGKAIKNGNAPLVADIMKKLGATGVAEATEAR